MSDSDKKWFVYHAYFSLLFWVVPWLVLIPAAALSTVVGDVAMWAGAAVWIPFGLLLLWCGLMSLVGYYKDAQQLKDLDATYQPIWPLWALGHLWFGYLLAPFYIYRRNRKVGNDYSDTRLAEIRTRLSLSR